MYFEYILNYRMKKLLLVFVNYGESVMAFKISDQHGAKASTLVVTKSASVTPPAGRRLLTISAKWRPKPLAGKVGNLFVFMAQNGDETNDRPLPRWLIFAQRGLLRWRVWAASVGHPVDRKIPTEKGARHRSSLMQRG